MTYLSKQQSIAAAVGTQLTAIGMGGLPKNRNP